jgi:hypothetical protein
MVTKQMDGLVDLSCGQHERVPDKPANKKLGGIECEQTPSRPEPLRERTSAPAPKIPLAGVWQWGDHTVGRRLAALFARPSPVHGSLRVLCRAWLEAETKPRPDPVPCRSAVKRLSVWQGRKKVQPGCWVPSYS